MIKTTHLIFYVSDQEKSTELYSKLLDIEPSLNVPGMTEFQISKNVILGLMPSSGIKKLLNNSVEVEKFNDNNLKAELYLEVKNIEDYFYRAMNLNLELLSGIEERDWGHKVCYFIDMDGYVIAFAEKI